MTETFQCASCSAPLEFEGTPIQKCQFCGNTVIVPSELLQYQPNDLSSLTGHALKIAEIRRLIADGNKIMAIKVFRETFGVGLKEAKDAVEALERGAGVDLSAIQVKSIDLNDPNDLKTIKRFGYTIGGSILGTTALVLVFTVGIILVIFYFTYRTVDRVFSSVANSIPTKSTSAGKSPAAGELLRFGGDGNGAGRFKDNRHVAVDGSRRIYSIDYSGGRLQVFDADGKFQTQWAANNDVPIRDLAVDRHGNVLVLDSNGLSLFDGTSGSLKQKLDKYHAEGVTWTLDGRVITSGRNGLAVLDANLKTLQDFKDLADKANAESGFGDVAVSGQGLIFAIDSQNGDVCKFSPDGKFLTRFSTGSSSPNSIAIDPKGRIYVAQTSKISVFDDNGRPVNSFPATQAFGIAFDDAGSLFVASRPFVVKYQLNF